MPGYDTLATLHGLFGAVALPAFWLAALARKGSAPHVLAGRVYLVAMAALLALAAPMAGLRLAAGEPIGAFLAFLVLITATAAWTAWRAIRDRHDARRYLGSGYRALAWLNLGGGAAILVLGVALKHPLLIGFSLIGLIGGRDMLRKLAAPPAGPRWWLAEHLDGMLGCAVATHIAFLSIGLPKLLPMLDGAVLQNLAWFGPLVLAVLARRALHRRLLGAARGATAAAAG